MGQTETKLELGKSGQFNANYNILHAQQRSWSALGASILAALSSPPPPASSLKTANHELYNAIDNAQHVMDTLEVRYEMLEEFLNETQHLAIFDDGPPTQHIPSQLSALIDMRRSYRAEYEVLKPVLTGYYKNHLVCGQGLDDDDGAPENRHA
jgi:hypothetical protein